MNDTILQQLDEIDRRLAELRKFILLSQAAGQAPPIRDPEAIPVMLTIREAAEKTGLSYDYIRRLCLQDKIIYIKVGSKYLINQEKLFAYLNGAAG